VTLNDIIIVVTAFVTLIIGALAKKFVWKKSKYIPYQNLIIGLLVGIIAYFTGTIDNLVSALITGCASTLAAGGLYDAGKVGKKDGK